MRTIKLTDAETRAVLDSISQMTDGNARDFAEWSLQTHGTRAQWNALLSAESKLTIAPVRSRRKVKSRYLDPTAPLDTPSLGTPWWEIER